MRYLLFPFILVVASCATQKKTVAPKPTSTPELSTKVLAPYQPSAQKDWELVDTKIDISFNFQNETANATTKISLHPYFYATDSVVLDAKGMEILGVRNGQNKDLTYTYDNLKLHIKLPKTYVQNDTLNLQIKYIAMPYASETQSGRAITQDRGLYFVNADKKEPYQPLQVWTQGETEANSHWFPTFDKTNFRSSFELTIHVPDSLKTLSNGILILSEPEKDNQRADTWLQKLPIPPYLVMMAIGDFHIEKDHWKNKEVDYYVPKKYAAYAKGIFNHTPEMIDFFSKKLKKDFPWDKYDQVVVYNYVSGAMENVSASLFGAFTLKDNRELKDDNNDFVVAHELFHQWFGDFVTAESWSQITLNESFADYSEKLWASYKYGEDEAEVERINSWNKYMMQAETSDPPLVRYHYNQPDDVFDRVSYSKGGMILHYLLQIVGDKAFFDALHLYLTQNALQSAESDQLRLSFEKVTGWDLKWFFDEWYNRGGHPVLKVDYQYNQAANQMTAIVTQTQDGPLYRLPVKAQIVRNGQSQMVDWNITQKQEKFSYPYAQGDKMAIIPDAEFWIPGAVLDSKNADQLLIQMKYADNIMPKYRALEMLNPKTMSADSIKLIIELAMKDNSSFIRKSAIEYLNTEDGVSFAKQLKSTLGNLAANDPDNDVRSAGLYLLGRLRAQEFSTTYQLAVSDSSYKVATAGLFAMEQINHNKASELARQILPNNMNSAMFTTMAARTIAGDAKVSDFPFFEQTIWHYYERDRSSFLGAFYEYLNNIKDIAVYKKGIDVVAQLIDNDVTSSKNVTSPRILYFCYKSADNKMKADKNSADATLYKEQGDYALESYQKVKATLKDQALLESLDKMEKGKE